MEEKINWKRKLSSRKLWIAIAAFASAIYIFVTHDEETAVQISAIVLAGGSVISYIVAEGWSDSLHVDRNVTVNWPEDPTDEKE